MKRIVFIMFLTFSMITAANAESFDFFRSTGKMYSVYAGVLLLFLGLAIYLFSLDRKITKLEKTFDNE